MNARLSRWSPAALIMASALIAVSAAPGNAEDAHLSDGQAAIARVSVNGDPIDFVPGGRIALPPRSQADLQVGFAPFQSAAAGPSGTRLLYKLEGLDADWQDVNPASNHMRISLIFFTDDGRTAGMVEFFMKGKSAGWRGTLAASQFSSRSVHATVPPDATRLGIVFWSGGAFTTVGILAIDRITIHRVRSPKEREILTTYTFEDPDASWERFGSDSTSAVTGTLNGVPVLEFIDADPENFGGWRLRAKANVTVTAGDELDVDWGELFSIGANCAGSARYRLEAPGTHRFRLAAATTEGVPTGVESVTEIVLPEPLWKRPWVWAACGLAVGSLLFGTWRYLEWNRMQIRLARLEKAHAVSTERTRIAQDLHDELGGSLTQIALASELAKDRLAGNDVAHSQLDTIFATARHLARQLDAVVWAISPGQDSVESLATFLSKEAQQYLRSTGVGCRIHMPDEMPPGQLSSIERRGIFLVIKEALHNVVQHAEAAEVWIRMTADDGSLVIEVEDDGRGVPPEALAGQLAAGHDGLANMRARMEAIGGVCHVGPGRGGRGTLVRLTVPLKSLLPRDHSA